MYHVWEDPSVQHKNRLPARGGFYYYESEDKALGYQEEKSAYYELLNGVWDFTLVDTPLRVGLAGLGTVGGGLAELLQKNAALVRRRTGRTSMSCRSMRFRICWT